MAYYRIDNQPAPVEFQAQSLLQRTLQNAKNLLMTRMGEVPFDRYRGLDPALFDLPMDQARAALLPEIDRVMLWEPDVEVADAACYLDENGEMVIEVTLKTDVQADMQGGEGKV